jgi:hypothetical protein
MPEKQWSYMFILCVGGFAGSKNESGKKGEPHGRIHRARDWMLFNLPLFVFKSAVFLFPQTPSYIA